MGKDNERFQGLTPDEVEREVAKAYIMGAVDHGVVVYQGEVIDGAMRETEVSIDTAFQAILQLEREERLVLDEAGEKMGKHGIPERAKSSSDDWKTQEETAYNLYHALVENGDVIDAAEAVEHAIFTAGITEANAKAAIWGMANYQEIDLSWDGKISKYIP